MPCIIAMAKGFFLPICGPWRPPRRTPRDRPTSIDDLARLNDEPDPCGMDHGRFGDFCRAMVKVR